MYIGSLLLLALAHSVRVDDVRGLWMVHHQHRPPVGCIRISRQRCLQLMSHSQAALLRTQPGINAINPHLPHTKYRIPASRRSAPPGFSRVHVLALDTHSLQNKARASSLVKLLSAGRSTAVFECTNSTHEAVDWLSRQPEVYYIELERPGDIRLLKCACSLCGCTC